MSSTSIEIENSTIIQGVTSEVKYIVVDVNNKKVGLPLYSFLSSTPDMDIVEMHRQNLEINDVEFVNALSPYNMGIALTVNTSAVCLPFYKLNTEDNAILNVNEATLVEDITFLDKFVAVKMDKKAYGLPIYTFSSLYPSQSAIPEDTLITSILSEPTQDTNTQSRTSTYANSRIERYSHLIDRLKRNLGYPFVDIELCDEQYSEYIDQAVEFYTQYCGYTEEFLVFESDKYPIGKGLHIPSVIKTIEKSYQGDDKTLYREFIDTDTGDFRKALDIFSLDEAEGSGLDSLFSLEYIYATQAYYTATLGSVGFDLLTWETLKQFLDQRRRSFATIPRWKFDVRTQRLRLIPEPINVRKYIGIIGLYLERPAADVIKERWVQQYSLALSKIAIGQIRTKFGEVQLFQGGRINGNDLLSQGLEEKQKLEEELLTTHSNKSPLFFIG